jgi:hypothetical protein
VQFFPAISGIDRIQTWKRPGYDRDMDTFRTLPVPQSLASSSASRDQLAADAALAAAIRKPLDALESAAEEAAAGMLGAAKLGLLVATNSVIEALEAVDAEFARRASRSNADRPEPKAPRHEPDTHKGV